MNKPSNTTNDVINVYFRTTIVSAFFYEAIIRSRFTKGGRHNGMDPSDFKIKVGIILPDYYPKI
jgi:hypothetical protein